MNFENWYKQKFNSNCEFVADYFADYIAVSASEIGLDWMSVKDNIRYTKEADKRPFIAKSKHLTDGCKDEVAIYASPEINHKYSSVVYPVITLINKGGNDQRITISCLKLLWEEYKKRGNENKTDDILMKQKLAEIAENKLIAEQKNKIENEEKILNVKKEINNFNYDVLATGTEYTERKKINVNRLQEFFTLKSDINNNYISFLIQDKKNFVGVQKIFNNGDKKFTYGMKKKGSFVLLGNLKTSKKIYFCEGFATGVSIFESTSYRQAVVVCLDINNMYHVIQSITTDKIKSNFELFICADNDASKKVNIGLTESRKYSDSFDIQLRYPRFGTALIDMKCSDFNDLHVHCGISAVKENLK